MKLKFLSNKENTFLLCDRLLFETNPWRGLESTEDTICPKLEYTSMWFNLGMYRFYTVEIPGGQSMKF